MVIVWICYYNQFGSAAHHLNVYTVNKYKWQLSLNFESSNVVHVKMYQHLECYRYQNTDQTFPFTKF